ncbi:MAG: PepSY-associated TM helix domain-containing protein [Caulobacter sp.]
MKAGLRQSMAWLHTWAGLVVGWVLLAIFVTGSAAYFQEEITRWMQPEIAAVPDAETATRNAEAYLAKVAPNSPNWFISVPGARSATTQVYWRPAPGEKKARGETQAVLDGQGRPAAARDTRGGFFLYRFHFDLHYMPVMWARYLVGVCAMAMLVAIVSGVITHKKIFTDFFTLRLFKGQRSWLDAHNVTAVLALPFYLMMTYTGLVTLATQYMPFGISAVYADRGTYFDAMFPGGVKAERTGRPVSLAPLEPMFAAARAHWNGAGVGYVSIANPGDASARVTLTRSSADRMASRGETLVFNGVTGRMSSAVDRQGAAARTESVMIGLHAGRYARTALRWLYFVCGLGGAAMVATGLVLWTVKRRLRLPDPERPHFGFRLVERLNIAAIAGLPAGIATYFLANRLLSLDLARRAEWEINSLFIAWGAVLVWAIARPARRAWIEALAATAGLYALVPVVSGLTTTRGLVPSLLAGDWVYAGFDLVMIVAAAAFAYMAWKVARRPAPVARPVKARRAEAAA